MKARVIKEYIDRHTKKFHAVGEEITLADERFAELERAGRYVEKIEHPIAELQEPEQPEQVIIEEQGEAAKDEQNGTAEQPKKKKTRKSRKQKSED